MREYPQLKNLLLRYLIFLPCLLAANHFLFAQVKAYKDILFDKYASVTHSSLAERPYYVASWESWKPAQIKIRRQLAETIAIIEIRDTSEYAFLKQQIRLGAANDDWKLSPLAERARWNDPTEREFIVSFSSTDALNNLVSEKGMKILTTDRSSFSAVIKSSAALVRQRLLPLKEVLFIDIRVEPHPEISIIGYNRSFHEINNVDYSVPGANGKNIVSGVKEQKMDELDIDLTKRVLTSSIAAANTTYHATVISSIIGGAGNSFYDGRGIANGCKFFPSTFDNLFADDPQTLNTNKVTVQNHSYGTIVQQFYGAEAVSYDLQTWNNKNLVHIFSSGNRGTSSATEGKYANIGGFANLTGNFKMAKNVVTVGAIDNKGIIPAESSAGPLYDGRIAPQLIALGPNGTSDAAAVVTGSVAVIQQVYADSNSQNLPAASLVKAVLYNTAEDVYSPGIDYKTGYGSLNSFAAIKSIQQKEFDGGTIAQGQQWTRTIAVPVNAAQFKVTLSWTDTAATANNNKALINDLDLEVVQQSTGNVFKPWVLNATPNPDSLARPPVRKRDSLNTAEQISISLPVAGNYQVRINGTFVSSSPVSFHIAFHVDTLNTFRFTSPQHASDVNREENPNADVRWKTFVSDTNQTGNLYVSYNGGTNWSLIKAGHKIYTNYYQWLIPDTNSRAILKMETGFGSFFSKEFIISKVTKLTVDFLCADSARLSWGKHVYANSYKVYSLVDSPYLKHILTLTDTFLVLNRSLYPNVVYAIEPIVNINIPAARSRAINITSQGVKCFFKTLYYTLLDENKMDLVLELSASSYVDSVYFERVMAGGQLLQTYGGTKAVNTISIYHQLIDDLPAGTSYWRARIKLRNGSVVYSDIIPVLTSGRRYILFYPNPIDRTGTLIYLLQQNLPTDSKLQLFDMGGRLLRSYSEIPNSINLKPFATGIVIYKLYGSDNRLLETGKLLVR